MQFDFIHKPCNTALVSHIFHFNNKNASFMKAFS